MGIDTNCNELEKELRRTELPEVDVTDRVMRRIHALHSHRDGLNPSAGVTRGLGRTTRRAGGIALGLLLIAAVTVSAAAVYETRWNGIPVKVTESGESPAQPGKEGPVLRELLREVLENRSAAWKAVSLEEARRSLNPYLRPSSPGEAPLRSFAVVPAAAGPGSGAAPGSPKEAPWLGGVYDLYEQGGEWTVVRQSLDLPMTQAVRKSHTLSMNYVGGWERVIETDRQLGLFLAAEGENQLHLAYKTGDGQVIVLELTGSRGKEELLRLAERYTGAGE
ncbi:MULTISPECIES: hypothetical protein [Paenibacillus]|uniref:hypothetical protein n=1 Tax=Paenibacillus TaxID=44249 RepID=UPI0022B8EBB5|nr:hypothetical protein [Paenibacillus caseinilyticus]MCZ8519209.1 hypothetical protein [Paenibacillus caseinilyticus]